MSVLVTADLHFNDNPRDGYRFGWMTDLRRMVREHKASHVLILGDLTDHKDQHRARLVNKIVDEMRKLALDCTVFILKGNHDYVDPDHPFFEFLGHFNEIHWLGAPVVMELPSIGQCAFFPHSNNLEAQVKPELMGGHNWIFTHQCYDGTLSESGARLHGTDPDIWGDHPRILSGDIHTPQVVDKRVEYVGAPYHIDFGDSYEPRVLLLDGKKRRSIPSPGPRKHTIVRNSREDPAVALDTFTWRKSDMVKLRIHHKDISTWKLTKERWIETFTKVGLIVCGVEPVLPPKRKIAGKHSTGGTQRSDPEIFEEFCTKTRVSKGVQKTGMGLIK